MRRWFGLVVGLAFWLGASVAAQAQPFQPRQAVQAVGVCNLYPTQERMRLDDVTTFWPNGNVEKAIYLLPPPFGPTKQPIAVAPDPSGIHFLAVRSAVNGVRFWVRWDDLRVVGIAASGEVRTVGDCSIDPRFVATFYHARPQMPAQMTDVAVELDGQEPTSNAVARLRSLPQGVYEEHVYNAPPVLANKGLAERCVASAARSEEEFYRCVIGGAMGDNEKRAYECASKSKSPQETAICLLGNNLGDDDRKRLDEVRACYRKHGTNWDQYPLCLAEGRADPRVMNLVSCARQTFQSGREPDYWSLGVCALGPEAFRKLNPNAEASIAIQCAVQTGGQPKLFVACTGGQLAIRELDKCLTDGIGGNGCFGKNNTLTKLYDQVGEGVAEAFGKKSLAYQAWQAAIITSNPAAAVKAMNDVAREVNRAGDNISAEAKRGLDKAGEAAARIMPQVKVGKPKGKVFGKKWSL